MLSVEEKYIFTTIEDAIREKDWAAGSSSQMDTHEFIIDAQGHGQYKPMRFPPALWKIIDEIVVNALDHLVRCSRTSTPVTFIKVNIDKAGKIRITNSGPGIEIEVHKVATERLGQETWVPTLVFGTAFQGMNRKQALDSIIGGTNGLGGKITNLCSVEFVVETVHEGRHFIQRWRDHKTITEPPTITQVDALRGRLPEDRLRPHTTVSFIPDYTTQFGYESFDEALYETLCDLIRTRMYFAAAYANYPTQHSADVYFNDVKIPVKSIKDIASILWAGSPIYCSMVTPTPKSHLDVYTYPWEICVIVTDSIHCGGHIGVVNGVVVRDGKHYKHISTQIIEGVRDKISKAIQDKHLVFSSSQITNNVFILLNTKLRRPSWTGQRKDVLDIDIRKLSGYKLDSKFTAQIADRLQAQIMTSILGDIPAATGKKKRTTVLYDDYKPAVRAGTKDSLKCNLIALEGHSALSQAATGICHNLKWVYYGAIALGGVIINVRKNCAVVETATAVYVKNKTKKLTNNEFMKVLTDVTGLNQSYKYDPKSATYDKEMSELNYGSIIACVDQDLDGKGNILGLLLNTFELFWPRLLAAGYIKWFCTPIVRAYPTRGGQVMNFYSIYQFETWAPTANLANYEIRYYKGIASHERDETIRMFGAFSQNLHTYRVDDRSRDLFDIYYGRNADLRKTELKKPIVPRAPAAIELQERAHVVCCSEHLEYETFLYQKDNLERKLDHVIDGQNQAGRKVLDGILTALKKPNKKLKVAQLAGYISEKKSYHHGEMGLSDTIAGKAFITTGGKQLPFLIPLSQFGSRLGGNDDAGQPRYIWAKLNHRITALVFPPEDYWILPFNFDEGVRAEPKYFAPIIPLVICESTFLPAHGWNLKLWARDVEDVIKNVKRLIRLDDRTSLLHMAPCVYKGTPYAWKGRLGIIRGEPYSFGTYKVVSGNVIIITELPLRVWTDQYVKTVLKKKIGGDIVVSISNESDDVSVNIKVKLCPGALDKLDLMGDSVYTDGVEEYFLLRDRMYSNINLMAIDGSVLSLPTYESVMYEWFPVRKAFYAQRIDRQRTLLALRIRRQENIIRYIEESSELMFSRATEAYMVATLTERRYDKLDVGLLNEPKFTPTAQLEATILTGANASFTYLLKLSDLKKSSEALTKARDALTDMRAELTAFEYHSGQGRFPGAALWEAELDALWANIQEGQRTFWKYGEADKFKY